MRLPAWCPIAISVLRTRRGQPRRLDGRVTSGASGPLANALAAAAPSCVFDCSRQRSYLRRAPPLVRAPRAFPRCIGGQVSRARLAPVTRTPDDARNDARRIRSSAERRWCTGGPDLRVRRAAVLSDSDGLRSAPVDTSRAARCDQRSGAAPTTDSRCHAGQTSVSPVAATPSAWSLFDPSHQAAWRLHNGPAASRRRRPLRPRSHRRGAACRCCELPAAVSSVNQMAIATECFVPDALHQSATSRWSICEP